MPEIRRKSQKEKLITLSPPYRTDHVIEMMCRPRMDIDLVAVEFRSGIIFPDPVTVQILTFLTLEVLRFVQCQTYWRRGKNHREASKVLLQQPHYVHLNLVIFSLWS